MSLSITARVLSLAAAAVAAAPSGAAESAPPDPAVASAPVPPLKYSSPLAGFRPFADDKPTPWRQANDAAAAIGGWRAYAREVRQPEPAASAGSDALPAGRRAP